jgi:hypothetical protein
VVAYPYNDGLVAHGISATLQQSQKALLAAMFLSGVTIIDKAVAVIEAFDNPCILALGASGTDVEVAEFVRLNMPNCSVVSNSIGGAAIELDGSTSSLIAETLIAAGEVSLNGTPIDPGAPPPEFTLSLPALIGAPKVADPYAGSLTHAFLTASMPKTGRCRSSTLGGVTSYQGKCVIPGSSLTHAKIKLSAATQISGGWSVVKGQTVDLSPGTYWVTGDLTLQSGAVFQCSACDNVQGTGVTIILTAQTTKIGTVSAGDIVLNSPRSGQFAGLLIVQDSNDLPAGTTYTSSHSILGGGAGASVNGLVYLPGSSLTFHGNPSMAGPKCLLLVVSAVNIDASSSLDTSGCVGAGLANLPVVNTVALAE